MNQHPRHETPGPLPVRDDVSAQQLRLMSSLVVLIGIGLFLALPFVLSIGSVVFLPLVTAVLLTILEQSQSSLSNP